MALVAGIRPMAAFQAAAAEEEEVEVEVEEDREGGKGRDRDKARCPARTNLRVST